MKFSLYMASVQGRILRIVAGAALIVIGLLMQSALGVIIAVVGAVPLLAGIFDVCVFAPLMGMPFRGDRIRARGAAAKTTSQ